MVEVRLDVMHRHTKLPAHIATPQSLVLLLRQRVFLAGGTSESLNMQSIQACSLPRLSA